MNGIRDVLDRRLGRVTMYRLVTLALAVLVVISMLYAGIGSLGEGLFSFAGQVISLLVLLVTTSRAAGRWRGCGGCGRTWSRRSSRRCCCTSCSSRRPMPASWGWLALAAVLASASKFVLAWRGRHVFNPAAAGAFSSTSSRQ